MSTNSIYCPVLKENTIDYGQTVIFKSILCQGSNIEGEFWRIPQVSNGVVTGYVYRYSEQKPTNDSVKCVRVKEGNTGNTFYVAIADGASGELFNSTCRACCDGTTTMPGVTIPDVIIEEKGCANDSGNFVYTAFVPTVASGTILQISGSENGVPLPATPPEGFASAAAFVTWAGTNWTGTTVAYDSGTKLLSLDLGNDGKTGGLVVTLAPYYESNTPGSLTSGQHYVLNATLNGTVLPTLTGSNDAALTTIDDLANANPSYRNYGIWSSTGGKIRLVANNPLTTSTIAVTKV